MKNYVINAFITKNGNVSRNNFSLMTDKNNEVDIKVAILEKLEICQKWIVEKETYELIESESVIRYKLYLKPSGIEPKKEKKAK